MPHDLKKMFSRHYMPSDLCNSFKCITTRCERVNVIQNTKVVYIGCFSFTTSTDPGSSRPIDGNMLHIYNKIYDVELPSGTL